MENVGEINTLTRRGVCMVDGVRATYDDGEIATAKGFRFWRLFSPRSFVIPSSIFLRQDQQTMQGSQSRWGEDRLREGSQRGRIDRAPWAAQAQASATFGSLS